MIVAGVVGTLPGTILVGAWVFRTAPDYEAPLIGCAIVIAAIAAVSYNWLFSPNRTFG